MTHRRLCQATFRKDDQHPCDLSVTALIDKTPNAVGIRRVGLGRHRMLLLVEPNRYEVSYRDSTGHRSPSNGR
jgi:hypothetical protein